MFELKNDASLFNRLMYIYIYLYYDIFHIMQHRDVKFHTIIMFVMFVGRECTIELQKKGGPPWLYVVFEGLTFNPFSEILQSKAIYMYTPGI